MTKNQKALKVFLILLNRYEILCNIDKNGIIKLNTPCFGGGRGRTFYDAVIDLVQDLDYLRDNEREAIRKIING